MRSATFVMPRAWAVLLALTLAGAGGDWWQAFGDAQIDTLVTQANAANQSLQQAEAQYRQAQA
ncbi:MAG: hypothetical protein LBQ32_12225, partial [Burkholderiaceae bacterium]|nr:hypothetical protein [Burkholderiaceae bacterium]